MDMEWLKPWFHHYPMLAGIAFGLLVVVVLGLFVGVLMHQAGLSLKPLVWFFGLLALVGGPQAVLHGLDAVAFSRQPSAQPAAPDLQPVDWNRVFGADADPALLTDPRTPLQAVLGEAQAASLSFAATGESALAARFDGHAQSLSAFRAYVAFFQLGSGQEVPTGWTARRNSGEWNHVVVAGNELYAWTGASRERVEARRAEALGSAASPARTPRAHEARLVTGRLDWRLMLPFAALNLLVVVWWFFWGAHWATRLPAAARMAAAPVSVAQLQERVLRAYGADTPVQASLAQDGSITLDWRYADARWLDLMRAHKLTRLHRVVLRPDTARHTVRVSEYWSAFDASAGIVQVQVAWHAASGIRFFQLEQHGVLGVQLDQQGRPTGDLSQVFRFDLQAMKGPAMQAVTGAGWNWQPGFFNGPAWLSWLTG